MTSALVLTADNAILNTATETYSQFQYNFPSNTTFDNRQVAPSTIIVPYSWYNIRSDTYQNNVFQYIWVDGSVNTVTMPSGYYSASDINNYLDSVMIENTHYLISGSGDTTLYNYYLNIQENSTYYAIQLSSYAVPTAAEAETEGLTQPAGATWSFPSVATNPQFVIPPVTTNSYGTSFSTLIGFDPQTWPVSQTPGSSQSILSNFTPEFNPVSSVFILCTLVDNRFSGNNQVLYAFSPAGTTFGDYINIQVPQQLWIQCTKGFYQSFTITFVDQSLVNPVPMEDNTITVILNVRDTPLEERGLKEGRPEAINAIRRGSIV